MADKSPALSSESERTIDGGSLHREKDGQISSDVVTPRMPGVVKIEAVAAQCTGWVKPVFWIGIWLLGWSYSLDSATQGVYLAQATNSFQQHSSLATLNVVRSLVAAVSQLPIAKLTDVAGRVEVIFGSLVIFIVGHIILATSNSVGVYAAGTIFYQFGIAGIITCVFLLASDFSSLRSRMLAQVYIASPFLINTWIAGNVTSSILEHSTWRWGLGMWAIVVPVAGIPFLTSLVVCTIRAKKADPALKLVTFERPTWQNTRNAMRELDIIGLFLLTAALTLILIPLQTATGADAASRWQTAPVLAPLIVGFACFVAFVLYEWKFASMPLFAPRFFANRTILGTLGIAFWVYAAYMQVFDYLYTVLFCAFNESNLSATRLLVMYSFVGSLTGIPLSICVRQFRIFRDHIRILMFIGVLFWILGFGLMIRWKNLDVTRADIFGSIFCLGLGGGAYTYLAPVVIQAAVDHEHMAVVTGIYLCVFNVGAGLGAGVSGAMWRNIMPGKLLAYLQDPTLAAAAFAAPFTFVIEYPFGSPQQIGMAQAQVETQRLNVIVGIAFSIPLLTSVLIMKKIILKNQQSIPEKEQGVVTQEKV